jgi:hypothetical protein
MSRNKFWMLPMVALGLTIIGGALPAQARIFGQAGAVDPSTYNMSDGSVSNMLRPTLVLPQHASVAAAARPADGAKSTGWSPVNGPYTSAKGKALSSNQLPGDATNTRVVDR